MSLELRTKLKDADFRAVCVLIVTGIAVSVAWLMNATLVYDDIAFPSNFSALVNQIGWGKALIKIFVLDLPNEYRTYGISRVIQFLLWSIGADSAHVYSALISLSHLCAALALYALLMSIRADRGIALSSSLMWLLSPFIWTSCFHHYSYLILPIQLVIIGSYFLMTKVEGNGKQLLAVCLGIALALTGELHVVPACFVLFVIALASGNRANLRALLVTIGTMAIVIVAHHLTWKIFAADHSRPQRFTLSLLHNADFWLYRIFVAVRGIGRSVLEQLAIISAHNYAWLIKIAAVSSLMTWAGLGWVSRGADKGAWQGKFPARPALGIAAILVIASCIYLVMFVLVVVLTDSVPDTMPRRYGYIPLTTMLIGLGLASAALIHGRRSKIIALSLTIGVLAALFIQHQWRIIPTTNAADARMSRMIGDAVKQNPDKVVLFFHASEDVFPRISIDGATPGPAMRDVTSAEVTQAKYGTYWPAYINITKVLGASYTCELGSIQRDGKLKLVCPPWQDNPGTIDASKVVIVANLGFDKFDPFGEHLKVFQNYSDFEPHFFAKRIIRDINWKENSGAEVIAINLGATSPSVATDDIFPDKHLNDPMTKTSNTWLKNYGWKAGEDRVYKFPSVSVNSEYFRSNRNGNFEYSLEFSESDIDIDLDFWELWKKMPGQRSFEVQVSWNDGVWVSLGKIDPAQINGDKPFSIHLAHQKTHSFSFRLASIPGSNDVPFIQGVRVTRRPFPNVLH